MQESFYGMEKFIFHYEMFLLDDEDFKSFQKNGVGTILLLRLLLCA